MDAGRDLTIEVACHNWTKDRLIMTSRQGEHVGDRLWAIPLGLLPS
jgi:hypothetical protein